MKKISKEIFDKVLAIFILILSFPLLFIVCLVIFIFNGRPIFFQQERVGLNRKKFVILKLRTMKDEKITFIGKWLRKTGLDEIPQLLNVFGSTMSIVGPRPLTEQDTIRLGWDNQKYDARFKVKPGITGLAQLSKRCDPELSWSNDLAYIKTQSFLLDLKIVFISFIIGIFGKDIIKKLL